MNRRTLISKLAAFPFIGFLFRPIIAAPTALVPSFIPPEGAILSIPFQNKVAGMIPVCLYDLSRKQDKIMVALCGEITIKIREVLEECKKDGIPLHDIHVSWVNIPDSETNPDGQVGTCRITALRGNCWPYSGSPTPAIPTNEFRDVFSAA